MLARTKATLQWALGVQIKCALMYRQLFSIPVYASYVFSPCFCSNDESRKFIQINTGR